MSHYTQLTQAQRYQIYAMKKAGFPQLAFATEVGVDTSTISRELKRNSGHRGLSFPKTHVTLNQAANRS